MDTIDAAKEKLAERILSGFTLNDIPNISDMIRDIETIERYAAEHNLHSEPSDVEWYLRNIESELSAAEKYIKWFTESGDASFKQIAADEANHADALIKKLRMIPNQTPDEQSRLQNLVRRYQEVARKVA